MHKISVCAIAAVMVAIGLRVWAAPTSTPVIPSVGQGVDPYQIMTNRGGYPFTGGDYTRAKLADEQLAAQEREATGD